MTIFSLQLALLNRHNNKENVASENVDNENAPKSFAPSDNKTWTGVVVEYRHGTKEVEALFQWNPIWILNKIVQTDDDIKVMPGATFKHMPSDGVALKDVKKHIISKRWICPWCDRSFTFKSSCTRHYNHSGVRKLFYIVREKEDPHCTIKKEAFFEYL